MIRIRRFNRNVNQLDGKLSRHVEMIGHGGNQRIRHICRGEAADFS
ncbi:hypothetical protein EVA_08362 [gut metagenome]|uniref:Uncharacterized protein n=1 Tax=gut metagenome TaxID=749906 RepID=J9GTB6_9ZZZZ